MTLENSLTPGTGEILPLHIASGEESMSPETEKQMGRLKAFGKAAITAIPRELADIGHTFVQGWRDYAVLRRKMRSEDADETSFSPTQWAALKLWNYAVFPSYQALDDVPGLAAYLAVQEAHGPGVAWLVTAGASTIVAGGLAFTQRSIEEAEARHLGIEVVEQDGDQKHDLAEAATNSAPWGVMRYANRKRRSSRDPITLPTKKRTVEMAATYGLVNTTIYSLSNLIPGVNSWTAFCIMIATMYQVRSTVSGYKEYRKNEEA